MLAMKTTDALKIALDLARQNVIDQTDDADEHAKQVKACDILEEVIANEFD
jgi:hypothetical protein